MPWPAVLPADTGWQQAIGCLSSGCCSPRRRGEIVSRSEKTSEDGGNLSDDDAETQALGLELTVEEIVGDRIRFKDARRSAAIARGNARGRDGGGRANDREDAAASGDRPRTSAHIRAELRPGKATFAWNGLSTGEVFRARIKPRKGRQISPCSLAQAAWARSRDSPRRSFGARRSATDGTISSSRP